MFFQSRSELLYLIRQYKILIIVNHIQNKEKVEIIDKIIVHLYQPSSEKTIYHLIINLEFMDCSFLTIEEIEERLRNSIQPENVLEPLSDILWKQCHIKVWSIQHGEYTELWAQLFNALEIVPVYHLLLCKNYRATILKDISTTHYSELMKLNLNGNEIDSIECLQHLDAPNLEILLLKNNCITELRSFRKALYPKLEQLWLSYNSINEKDPLTLVNYPLEKLLFKQGINVVFKLPEYFERYYETFMFKLKTKRLKTAEISQHKQIENRKLTKQVLNKYPIFIRYE